MNLPGKSPSGEAKRPTGSGATEGEREQDPAAAETPADAADRDRPDSAGTTGKRSARHRLAESIAEGLLPTTTSDERGDWGDGDGGHSAAWYAENRPPHHDR